MRVFVCGASGFVGGAIVDRLASEGNQVVALIHRAALRGPAAAGVAQVHGDLAVPLSYRGQLLHCDASVNAVGLLRQRWDRRGVSYSRVVVKGTQDWVQECREAGVKHIVLISANGADPDGTAYQRSKWLAEQAVRNSGLAWTILRPSLIVGAGGFVDQLARLMRWKLVPVFGKQDYLFEPVALSDVVTATCRSLKQPKARNRVLHLGGPDQASYREMVTAIAHAKGKKPWIVPAPRFLGFLGAALLGWLPFFPATVENLRLLFKGNLVPEHDWEAVFRIAPKGFDEAMAGLATPHVVVGAH